MSSTDGRSLPRVALSYDELTFAILDESHTVLSQALSSVVLEAVKSNSPNDWKKKICDRFTDRTRSHLERCLDCGQVTDIYVICKILQRFIHDVAKFCGGFKTSAEKERLSLQTQGIETGRNWAFHGELLSSGEVFLSIGLSQIVLTKLKCNPALAQRLSNLQDDARRLVKTYLDSDYSKHFTISAHVLGRTLLYSSFTSFEKLFKNFFGNFIDHQHSSRSLKVACHQQPGIASLVKRIRKELYKPNKESLLVKTDGISEKKLERGSILASLDNIISTRNKLAHNAYETLSFVEIKKALLDVSDVLSAFGLVSEETKLAHEQLVIALKEGMSKGNALNSVESILRCTTEKESGKQRQRVLRPHGNFIGRTQQLQFIINFLCDRPYIYGRMTVMIYGPAGIGKSYLATESACELRGTYPRQAWVSCSSVEVFQQDLASHPHSLFHTLLERHVPGNIDHICSSKNVQEDCRGNFQISTSERQVEKWLIVLDDVCTATACLVYQGIAQSHNSFIITTRSTAVKGFFLRMVPQLQPIALRPFSTAESWEMIMKKTERLKISKSSIMLIDKALSSVLGNLPLCVNIYASLLASASKKKSGSQPVAFDSDFLLLNWKDIEDQFGDRLHVRGLTGVVDSAQKYLSEHPFAVFLLVKICSSDSERIMWNTLRKRGCTVPTHGYKLFQRDEDIRDLCVNLLGVLDFLFSESGQEILETCRGDLEELGLISWNNESLTVNIHRLTLYSTRQLLHQNSFFLHPLVANVIVRSIESSPAQTTSNWLSEILTCELLLQVISRTEELIQKFKQSVSDENSHCEDNSDGLLYGLLLYLELLVGSPHSRRVLGKQLLPEVLTQVLCTAHVAIRDIKHDLKISFVGSACSSMSLLYKSSSSNSCYYANVLKVLFSLEQGLHLQMMGLLEEALVCYKTALAVGQNFVKHERDPVLMLNVHLCYAGLLQELEGISARNKYLMEAAEACHLLKTGLTKEHVQQLLDQVRNSSRSENHADSFYTELIMLDNLTHLKLGDDGFIINGNEKETILECASLLTSAIQEVHTCVLQKLEEQTPITRLDHVKIKQISYFHMLLDLTARLLRLDVSLDQTSASISLQTMLQIYSILEERLPKLALCLVKETDRNHLWLEINIFLDSLCQMAHNSGLFELAASVSHRFVKLWDKIISSLGNNLNQINFQDSLQCNSPAPSTPKLHCAEFNYECINVGNDEQVQNQLVALTFDCIWTLHDKTSLQQSLSNFMTVLKAYTFLNFKVPELSGLSELRFQEIGRFLLCMCFCISVLLGREVTSQAVHSLAAIADNNTTQAKLQKALQQTIKKLRLFPQNTPFHSLYMHFAKAKHAFDQGLGTRMTCRTASLAYWKGFLRLKVSPSEGLTADELNLMQVILHRFLTQSAEYLWKVYFDERKYAAAEWFLRFCGSFSKRMNSFLDSAKYGVEYVEFLKRQHRWSEALQQCRHVEEGLVEQFGKEYSKWLPEAPDTTLLRQSLEEEVSKRESSL